MNTLVPTFGKKIIPKYQILAFFCLIIDAFFISEKKGLLVIVALFCTTYFGVATFFFFT